MLLRLSLVLSICRPLFATSIALACLATVAFAVGSDRALYVGGTLKQFEPRSISGLETLFGGVPQKTEGRINLASDSEIVFDAGRRGVLAIPYTAITSLEYGLERGRRFPKGRGLVLSIAWWDPTEQYTKKAHNLLTIVFQDQSATEQAIVLELGRDLVRPTLGALERRTGKAIEFLNIEACMLFKNNAEACEYGQTGELKGLKRMFLDSSIAPQPRKVILSEIEKGNAGLELVENPDSAEIILNFQSARSFQYNFETGRGEVSVVRAGRRRVVLVFTGMKTALRGKNPAEDFGRTFINAVRGANGLTPIRD